MLPAVVSVLAGSGGTALLAALAARIAGPSWILVWVVLVPWLLALDRLRSKRAALFAGWLGAVSFTLAVLGWFAGAIASYTGAPLLLAWLVLTLAAPLLQPQLVVVALARVWARSRAAGDLHGALLTAAGYVGVEWASAKLFGDTLAHGLYPSAVFRQAADLGGAIGLSFAVVLANHCAARIFDAGAGGSPGSTARRRAGAILSLVGLLALLGAYGHHRLQRLGDATPLLEVAAIQAGLADYPRLRAELGTYDAVRLILEAHFGISEKALVQAPRPIDLLVWPETVYPTTYGSPKSPDGAAFDRAIENFVATSAVPLIFGTYVRVGDAEFNAAALVVPRDGGAGPVASYQKQRLFPFTERTPALLDFDLVHAWLPWLGTWRPGGGPAFVDVPLRGGREIRVAPLVCYDAVDPDLAMAATAGGAELLLVLSNDSWFAHGAGPHQHLVVSAFRSIETRRPQVRATSTGISAVIDARGEMLAVLGAGTRGALVAAVPRGPAQQPWAVWVGPWVGPAMLGLALFLALAAAVRRRV